MKNSQTERDITEVLHYINQWLRITGRNPIVDKDVIELSNEIKKFYGEPRDIFSSLTARQFLHKSAKEIVSKDFDVTWASDGKALKRLSKKQKTAFFSSLAWRRVRYGVLKRSNGICELCGASPTKDSPLHVDHIKPISTYPHLKLDPNNLQVLCQDCNMGKGNRDTTDWRK